MASAFFQRDTPHGLMKRIIYKMRLQGFIPKTLQSGYRTIIYDGFSGSGKYNNEWPTEIEKYGSPIIALRVAINYFIKKKDVQDKTFGVYHQLFGARYQLFGVRYLLCGVHCPLSGVYYLSQGGHYRVKKIEHPMTLEDVDSLVKKEVTLYFVEKSEQNFANLVANVCSVLSCYGLDFSMNCPHCVVTDCAHGVVTDCAHGVVTDCAHGVVTDCAHGVVTVQVYDVRFPVVCHLFWSSFQNIPCPTVDDRHFCFAFIDPFGFSIELDKIADFMGPRKDAIFNFMSSFVNRFGFVGKNPVLVEGLFGIDIPQEIREQGKIREYIKDKVREMPENAIPQASNVDILVNNFCKTLSDKVGSDLNLVFEMKDKGNRQLYHLIFNTHNRKGYKHMKYIMVSCNQDESFSTAENPQMKLSDFRILKNNLDLNLSIEQDNDRIADLILERFQGQTVDGTEVENYVAFETPFVFQKKQLKIIEYKDNPTRMTVRDTCGMPRRRGTYAHLLEKGHIELTFAPDLERMMAALGITDH